MEDLLPQDTFLWNSVEAIARDHFTRAGINEIRTPLIEITDLFSRGIGEDTDVVGKEMYTFQDRGKRSCTLRPEGTASVVRAAIENGLISQGSQRLWYSGPMFRYERPQAGRQRQFHQLGVEFLGLKDARSDAEIISLAWDLIKDFGIKNLELEINSLGTDQERTSYKSELVKWLESKSSKLDPDSQNRLKKNPLRILDSKNETTQEILKSAPRLSDQFSQNSQERFAKVQKTLECLGIPFSINHNLVRGLDYYDHTAFEIKSTHLGSQATVCGGGRYDRLIEQLGGPSTPAIGWAIGLERLMLLIHAASTEDPLGKASTLKTVQKPDLYIINQGETAEIKSLTIAQKLRALGIRVELDCTGSSFGKQFKRADRSGARYALVIGDKEVISGQGNLKFLRASRKPKNNDSSQQQLQYLDDLESLISKIHEPLNLY